MRMGISRGLLGHMNLPSNGISIGSSVSAQLAWVPNRHTALSTDSNRHVGAICHPKTLKPNFSPLQPEINVMQTTPYFKNASDFQCHYYMHAVQEYLLVIGLIARTVKNKIRLWLGNGNGEQWKWTSIGTGMTPIPIGKIPMDFFEICAPWCKSNITDVTFWRMTAEIFCLIFKVSWMLFL